MAARTLKRFIFACITIFFVIAFNFFLFRVMPGDISSFIAKATTSDAVKERLLAEAGVDQPLLTQFWIYLEDLLPETSAIPSIPMTEVRMYGKLSWEESRTP